MDEKEKEHNRNEKLGEYFLNLSNTTLGTTVLGVLTLLIVEDRQYVASAAIFLIIVGFVITISLALVGNEYLKR